MILQSDDRYGRAQVPSHNSPHGSRVWPIGHSEHKLGGTHSLVFESRKKPFLHLHPDVNLLHFCTNKLINQIFFYTKVLIYHVVNKKKVFIQFVNKI